MKPNVTTHTADYFKRRAKTLKKNTGLPHHAALDKVVQAEGFSNWSHFQNHVGQLSQVASHPSAPVNLARPSERDRPRAQWYRWGGVRGSQTEIARLERNGYWEVEDVDGNIYYVGDAGHIIHLYADGTWDSDKARPRWSLTDYFAWSRPFRAALRHPGWGGKLSEDAEAEVLEQDVTVMPIKDRPGKFRVLVPNPAAYGLSPNYGALTEQEVHTLLANKYRKSTPEIEALMSLAELAYIY